MPIYEYACESCGHVFEIRQRFSDEPILICPECGAAVRRVLHPVGVIFKGSGFYLTDNRKSKDLPENGSAKKPESKSEAKSEPPAKQEATKTTPAKTADA